MPVFHASEPNGNAPNKLSIPILVDRYIVDDNGVEFIQGRRLDRAHRGESVAITLSEKTSQKKRPSIQDLREGYVAGNSTKRLDPGGIISFRDCWPIGNGLFASKWPNVIAYTDDDIRGRVVHAGACILRLGEETGQKPWGEVLVFDVDQAVELDTIDQLMQASGRFVKDGQEQGRDVKLYLRALNDSGQVVTAVEIPVKGKTRTEGGETIYENPPPSEIAQKASAVASALCELTESLPAHDGSRAIARWNLLPMQRVSVSARTLAGRGESSKNFTSNLKAFKRIGGDGEETLFAQEAFLKVGGNVGLFVNGIFPVDPYGNGMNPDLLGDLVYIDDPIMDPRSALRAVRDQQAGSAPRTQAPQRQASPNGTRQPREPQAAPSGPALPPGFREAPTSRTDKQPQLPDTMRSPVDDLLARAEPVVTAQTRPEEMERPHETSRPQGSVENPGDVFAVPRLARNRNNRPT